MDPPPQGSEEGSPRLYHLELYDSAEDLEMFSEPFRRRDLVVHEKRMVQSAEKPAVSSVDIREQVPGNEETSQGKDDKPRKGTASYGAEEENPAREADTYCITCCVPIRALDKESPQHEEHDVIPISSVVEIARVRMGEGNPLLDE